MENDKVAAVEQAYQQKRQELEQVLKERSQRAAGGDPYTDDFGPVLDQLRTELGHMDLDRREILLAIQQERASVHQSLMAAQAATGKTIAIVIAMVGILAQLAIAGANLYFSRFAPAAAPPAVTQSAPAAPRAPAIPRAP